MNEGRKECQSDRQIGAATPVSKCCCCGEVRWVFKQSCWLIGRSMIAPRVLYSDQQNKMDTSGRKEFLPNGVWAFFKSKGEELGQSGATQSKAAAHLFQKEPIEVTSYSWALSGMSHWGGGGQTQDTRGRLCLSVCLGAPRCPWQKSWREGWGDCTEGISA